MNEQEINAIANDVKYDISKLCEYANNGFRYEVFSRQYKGEILERVDKLVNELIRLYHENYGLKQTINNLKEKEAKRYKSIVGGKYE